MELHADKRASPRIPVKVPLLIEGRDVRHKPVTESSETLLINDAGALLALAAEFQLHDRFFITNQNTKARSQARVAWRSSSQIQGRWSYGVALVDSPDNFWGIGATASPLSGF